MSQHRTSWTISVALVVLFAAGPGRADTLVLDGGDVLSGDLVQIADGTLTFRTTLSGQMLVAMDQVQSIATGTYRYVELGDGPRVPGRFVIREAATHMRHMDGTVTPPLDLTAIASVTPLPDDTSLQGAWETGVHWRSGNKDYTDLFARLALRRQTDDYMARGQFWFERTDPEGFPRWFRADAEWRVRPNDRLYPLAALEIERDTSAALSLRGDLSVGIGKRLLDWPLGQLEGDLGLGASSEYFDLELRDTKPTINWPRALRGHDATRVDRRLHLRLRLRYARSLFGEGTFDEDFRFYPSLTGLGDLRVRSASSVLVPFSERFKLKFNVLVDYDSGPEFRGLDQWRTAVGASLLWDF